MIVRNEEDNLETALALPSQFVDEIVIVDTGSTDGTPEIAKKYADVYAEIVWPDSFAEARNHSLSLATQPYILILDADDAVATPLAMRRLMMLLENPKLCAAQFQIHSTTNQGHVHNFLWQTRLFMNTPEIRYQGIIHNQIDGSIKEYAEGRKLDLVRAPGVHILHSGYDLGREERVKKYEPRIALLQKAKREAATLAAKAYYSFNLAGAYHLTGLYLACLDEIDHTEVIHLSDTQRKHLYLTAVKSHLQVKKLDLLKDTPVNAHEAARNAALLLSREGDPYGLLMSGALLAAYGDYQGALVVTLNAYLESAQRSQMQQAEMAHHISEDSLREILVEYMVTLGYDKEARGLVIGTPQVALEIVAGLAATILEEARIPVEEA